MAEDYRWTKSNKDERCKVHEELFRVQSLLSESLQEKSLHEILSSAR
jgi:hypothetical protein